MGGGLLALSGRRKVKLYTTALQENLKVEQLHLVPFLVGSVLTAVADTGVKLPVALPAALLLGGVGIALKSIRDIAQRVDADRDKLREDKVELRAKRDATRRLAKKLAPITILSQVAGQLAADCTSLLSRMHNLK